MKKKIWAFLLFFCFIFVVSAHAGYARILRLTLNDGTVKYFWVDQISKITTTTDKSSLSSSSVTVASSSSAKAASSSSVTVASSSSAKAASSSSVKVASSSSVTVASSSNVTVASSSSAKAASSSSAKATSSSSVKVASSSSAKVASSSSATVVSSSSAKAASSSSVKVASSSSAKAASSSSKKATSSSSKKSSYIASVEMFNFQMSWNARQQTLLLSAEKSTNAQVSVFDIQGIRVSRLNVPVLRGYNSVSLSSLHLANGKYVLHVEMDGVRLQKVISIGNVGK